jgi:uncharacterized protein (DUF2164 family)
MAITLPNETKQELIEAIQEYFRTERDEEIGNLQATLFMDFILRTIGPTIYNQAIQDARTHLMRFASDLDTVLFET